MTRHLERDLDRLSRELLTMGDLAVNISERAAHLAGLDPIPLPESFEKMLPAVQSIAEDVVFLVEGEIVRHSL